MKNRFKIWYQAFRTAWYNFRNGRKDPKKIFPQHKHIIKYAFSVAGVSYYCFDDVFAQPFERGLMALAVYEEARMNCSREYLQAHCEAMDTLMKGPEIEIGKIYELNQQLRERLNLVLDVDLLYKLASVIFFDKNENPSLYEYDYNNRKIEFWKLHRGVADFFLQKPVSELIPFIRLSDLDLATYSELNEALDRIHSEKLSAITSKNSSTASKGGKK